MCAACILAARICHVVICSPLACPVYLWGLQESATGTQSVRQRQQRPYPSSTMLVCKRHLGGALKKKKKTLRTYLYLFGLGIKFRCQCHAYSDYISLVSLTCLHRGVSNLMAAVQHEGLWHETKSLVYLYMNCSCSCTKYPCSLKTSRHCIVFAETAS